MPIIIDPTLGLLAPPGARTIEQRRKRKGRIPDHGSTREPRQKPIDPSEPPKKSEPDACPEPPFEAEIAPAEKAVDATEIAINEGDYRLDTGNPGCALSEL